jgi:hypothetical protein
MPEKWRSGLALAAALPRAIEFLEQRDIEPRTSDKP